MLKWIRPIGAIVFLIIISVIGLFWWLLADWLLKTSIETVGSEIVGARVELSMADFTFTPLGFRLEDLRVTNPKQPMQNLIQLVQVTGSLELLPLLMGKVIIDDLSATGVRLNTDRKTSGEIKKTEPEPKPLQEATEKSKLDLDVAKDKLPSVDEILAKEPLATLDQIKSLEERINTERADLDKNIAALPDEAKIKQQEKRIRELSESNIKSVAELQQRKQDLKKFKDEISADRDALLTARDQLKNVKSELNKQFDALKNAPSEDWNRLKSRYGLDAMGAGNVANLLFGESAQLWVNRILAWAEQAQNLLPGDGENTTKPEQPQRGKGRSMHFTTINPLPDFLIRNAVLSMEVPLGNFNLELKDATHQPNILGRPMRLFAQSNKLQNVEQIKIDGVIDHVKPGEAIDSITWSLVGLKMADVSISSSTSFPLTLSTARANVSGDIELKTQLLAANVKAAFNDAQWSSSATEGWTGRVAQSLTSIRIFNLDGQLQGKLMSPKITLRSDLDERLKHVAADQLKSAQGNLEKKFNAKLNDKIASVAGKHKDQLAFLTNKEDTLDRRIDKLNEMLKAKLKSEADTKKQEATDKLKDKIKGLKF